MLKGNLSTRPFYNERLVTMALGAIALAALALTVFNATQLMSLSAERAKLRAQIDTSNADAVRIRAEADTLQRSIDRSMLESLRLSTQEANRLIDQRAFSWTVFFDFIEKTLPIDVRLVSVQPRVERGVFSVAMLVVARAPQHLQAFVDNLDATGTFRQVFVTGQQRNDDGTWGATIETQYVPQAREAGSGTARVQEPAGEPATAPPAPGATAAGQAAGGGSREGDRR